MDLARLPPVATVLGSLSAEGVEFSLLVFVHALESYTALPYGQRERPSQRQPQ